jgi:hypothetical protein
MASAKPATKPAPAAAKPAAAKPAAAAPAKAAAPAPNKAVAARPSTGVAKRDENLPAYIKQGGPSRGNENVGTSDLVIPRIEVAQLLSPCLKESKPEFIEGCREGDIFNTVTREVYPRETGVLVIPILYKKEYLVWKDRKEGGGFRGSYPTLEEANQRIAGEQDAQSLTAAETGQQLVLVLREDGTTDESMLAMVSMSRTKLKVSKNWNSLIRLNGGDRFSRVYRLITSDEQNSNGDEYKNFQVMAAGFPEEEAYKLAEQVYESVASGQLNYKMDTSQEGAEDETKGSTEY